MIDGTRTRAERDFVHGGYFQRCAICRAQTGFREYCFLFGGHTTITCGSWYCRRIITNRTGVE
jgi:hypothetical protein